MWRSKAIVNLMSKPGTHPYAWLPVLLILLTVATLTTGSMALHYLERRLVASAGESLTQAAADMAAKVDLFLAEREGDFRVLARLPILHHGGVAAVTSQLQRVQEAHPVYQWIGVTDARGRIVAATDPSSVGWDRSGSAWFQRAGAGEEVQVLDAHLSEDSDGVRALRFTAPLRGPTGEFRGAVTALVGLPVLEDLFTRTVLVLQAQWGTALRIEYHVLTKEGDLIADSLLREEGTVNLKRLGVPSALLVGTVPVGHVEERHTRRGVPVITGFAETRGEGDLARLQWGILVRVERAELLAPINAFLWKLGVAGVAVIVPLLGLVLWTTGRLRAEWLAVRRECARATTAEGELVKNLAELRQSERRLAAQHAVASALATSATLSEAVPQVLEALCRALGWEMGVFWKVDRSAQVLRCVALWHAPEDDVGAFAARTQESVFAPGVGLPGRVWAGGEPAWIPDVTRDANFPCAPFAAQVGLHGAFAFPVVLGGAVHGVLECFSREIREPDKPLLEIAMTVGSQIGQFIQRHKAEEALADSNRELQAANRELEEMTSIIAHDLTAPLVTIQGFAERLAARCPTQMDTTSARYLKTIQEVSKVAGQMVRSLLDFFRIQGRDFRSRSLALETVMQQVCDSFAETIQATQGTVSVNPDAAGLVVRADPTLVYEVLANLVGNALKFAAPDHAPCIKIGARMWDMRVVVSVQDNGIGIPTDKLGEVFQVFRKLNKNTPGVGIGLAAVKKLVHKARGTVWIESTLGQGTTVYFTLPRA